MRFLHNRKRLLWQNSLIYTIIIHECDNDACISEQEIKGTIIQTEIKKNNISQE